MAVETASQTSTFPDDWETPFAEGGTFMQDAMHFPHPLTPLTQSAFGPAFESGIASAARELRAPFQGYQVRHRNYYRYDRALLPQPASDEEARQMAETAEASLKTELERLMERWHGEHLPRLQVLLERLRTLDAVGASDAAWPAMLDEVDAIHAELWTIHFRIAIPMLLGIQLLDELYADLFGGSEADSHALLVGGVSESVKAGFGISDLAASARALGLESLIRETPADALLLALQDDEAGRALLEQLKTYLDTYGLRQDLFELSTPTWQEDPTFALANLRNYVLAGRDARMEHAAMARSAESALESARARLASYPEAVRQQFEALVQAGREGSFLQEEHNFHIDQRGFALLHYFYLRVGERLVEAGLLASPDDIFLLTTGEIRSIFDAAHMTEATPNVRPLVEARRVELELARGLTPPPFIGPPPAAPPASNPMERASIRFFGGPPRPSDTPGELQGHAGSRGVVTGPARVARTLEEAQSLLPGEILVAVTTMPPWTPLFGVAAAVVTETGGPLSHCAIVAREYGIPAVVGAAGATRAIATGQTITVDGGRGVVTLAE